MPYYAQIDDARRVVAITETAGLVEAAHMLPINSLDESLLGRVHAAESGEFAAPDAPAATRWITVLAFRQRFTQSEKIALEIAQLDNPAATMQERGQAAALRVLLADVAVATYIDLDRADTREGVEALEAATLLGVGRAAEILDDEIQAHERYRGRP